MNSIRNISKYVYPISNAEFDDIALKIFNYQANYNTVYREFIKNIGIISKNIKSTDQIPFLPIQFYKNHTIKTGEWNEEIVFESSGTTIGNTSKHHISSLYDYQRHSLKILKCFMVK